VGRVLPNQRWTVDGVPIGEEESRVGLAHSLSRGSCLGCATGTHVGREADEDDADERNGWRVQSEKGTGFAAAVVGASTGSAREVKVKPSSWPGTNAPCSSSSPPPPPPPPPLHMPCSSSIIATDVERWEHTNVRQYCFCAPSLSFFCRQECVWRGDASIVLHNLSSSETAQSVTQNGHKKESE